MPPTPLIFVTESATISTQLKESQRPKLLWQQTKSQPLAIYVVPRARAIILIVYSFPSSCSSSPLKALPIRSVYVSRLFWSWSK